jgi:hypothetical protein
LFWKTGTYFLSLLQSAKRLENISLFLHNFYR